MLLLLRFFLSTIFIELLFKYGFVDKDMTGINRAISNFVFRDSEDERITELELTSVQYTGDTLYDVIVALCTVFDIGFKITLEEIRTYTKKAHIDSYIMIYIWVREASPID